MMNSWQEWVVALLLLLCAVRIGMSIYSFSHRVKENGNPCDSCASGCELKNQLSKLGNTPFEAESVEIVLSDNWFIPSSELSDLRRRAVEKLLEARRINYPREVSPFFFASSRRFSNTCCISCSIRFLRSFVPIRIY